MTTTTLTIPDRPAADIGSDHDLEMMTCRLRQKIAQQQTSKRMKYNVDVLNSPNLMQQFNAVLGGKFRQLIDLTDTDVDVDELTNTFNTAITDTAITDTATEVIGKC